MTLSEILMAELSHDRAEIRTFRVHSWTETWLCATRGRITYRLGPLDRNQIPSRLGLKIGALPELVCALNIPIRAHGYAGWAKTGDKQVARRVAEQVNTVLECVGI